MKKKKQLYICYDCRNRFQINYAGHIALQKTNRTAQCQRCGSTDTYPVGIDKRPKGSLDDEASVKQLKYIRSLGGNPKNVHTKKEASEMINRLKKIRT